MKTPFAGSPLVRLGVALALAVATFLIGVAPGREGGTPSPGVAWVSSAYADPEQIPRTGKFVVPAIQGPVTDVARILSAQEKSALADKLRRYKAASGHEIAILIVPALQDQPVEDVAFAVARTWRLGDEKRDHGVLVLWAVEERKVRIETGRGAEGDIPDATASAIIETRIRPFFKDSKWFDGLNAGIDGLIHEFGPTTAPLPSARPVQPRPLDPSTVHPAPELTVKQLLITGALGVLFVFVAIWRIRAVGILGFLSELFFFLSVLGRSGGRGGGSSRRDDDRGGGGGFGGGGGGFGGGGASGDY